jgi:expansin (peptidoglycan-binding protein)
MARLSLLAIAALTISGLVSAAPVQEVDLSKRSSYSGTATFFHPATEGGSTGACGPEEDNDSAIVALNAPQYGDLSSKSDWCGKTITIKGSAGTATAKINDACPECDEGSLDLTPSLFKKVVGEESIGEGDITWSLA